MSMKTVTLAEVSVGETFKIGRFEFIKFADENGMVIAVSKDCLFNSSFGDNNDFFKSTVSLFSLKSFNNEILGNFINFQCKL